MSCSAALTGSDYHPFTHLPLVQIREGDWKVAPIPADLQDRRVEITGPTDAKMVINALNSGGLGCWSAPLMPAMLAVEPGRCKVG